MNMLPERAEKRMRVTKVKKNSCCTVFTRNVCYYCTREKLMFKCRDRMNSIQANMLLFIIRFTIYSRFSFYSSIKSNLIQAKLKDTIGKN